MDIGLMVTILDRIELYDVMKFYERNNVAPVITMLGKGTATEKQLRVLGLDNMQKALIAGVISGSEKHEFFMRAKRELMIDIPGNGVMMSVPLKSVGGVKALSYISNERKPDREVPKMEFKYELIIVVVNSGYTDTVMDVAREAGAGGGTVIHAKGTGAKLANKFFGVSLAEEKEVMLIAEASTKKSAIMKSIAEKAGTSSPAGAICFSLPITEIAGIRMLED